MIRFPGGTDVDFMDWCDMIDNVPGQPPERPVSTGHRGHEVTNYFGYDEFLRFAVPYIAYSLPQELCDKAHPLILPFYSPTEHLR